MGNAWEIRHLGMADAPARLYEQVVSVLQEANRRADGSLPSRYLTPALWDQVYDAVYSVAPGRARFLVALAEGRVIGVGAYRPAWVSASGWDLAYWAVLPDWQGRGLGRALLVALLDAVAEAGQAGDFIFVRTRRPSAFRRLGFRPALGIAGDQSLLLGMVGSPVQARASA